MHIQRFAALSGLSAHTLRYYEKIGLLRHIARDTNGHRQFNERDIEWVRFIRRLKDTGMPLRTIQQYADLRESGDATQAQRRQLLLTHAQWLEDKIACDTTHLRRLRDKIAHYNTQLTTPQRTEKA